MKSELENFAHALASASLTETDTAVALLWYGAYCGDEQEATPRRLASLMQDLSLRGEVNVSRLSRNLTAHSSVVKGRTKGTYKLKLAQRSALGQKYEPFLARPIQKVDPLILPEEMFLRTRRYLENLARQINGTYQHGFYDGCAVLCRRLMETLLIEAFEAQGLGASIKSGKDYLGLADIIGTARSGTQIKLARGTADILEQVKLFGDAAAHSRTHITTQRDVDDIKLAIRRMISELMALAKIEPKPA